jgi:hypothetical protein
MPALARAVACDTYLIGVRVAAANAAPERAVENAEDREHNNNNARNEHNHRTTVARHLLTMTQAVREEREKENHTSVNAEPLHVPCQCTSPFFPSSLSLI